MNLYNATTFRITAHSFLVDQIIGIYQLFVSFILVLYINAYIYI